MKERGKNESKEEGKKERREYYQKRNWWQTG
jgi:hypothetical protein